MKGKAFAAIMLTLILATSLFYIVPTAAQPAIKIGIMGPMGLIQGEGMKEGAILASEELGGVINVDGVDRPIELNYFDEFQGQADGTAETGAMAMAQLVAWGADFAIGGFRSESVLGAREVAMDYCRDIGRPTYLTTGAATEYIIDCKDSRFEPCGACVRCDRDRYQYIFRITPVNSSALVASVTGTYYKLKFGFMTDLLDRMAKIYGSPVKYACVVEHLVWSMGFYAILSNASSPIPGIGLADLYLGSPNTAKLGLPPGDALLATDPLTGNKAAYLVSPTATDISAEMEGIKRSEARLIVQILSAEKAGRAFTFAMEDVGPKAIAMGINVIEQMSEAWDDTLGAVQYQGFLQTSPTRPPITDSSIPFWDAYTTKWGRAPIYTAYGAYLGMQILAAAIERAGTIDPDEDPVINNPEGVAQGRLIREIEATSMTTSVAGTFEFTGPNGIYHDVLAHSIGKTWTDGYTRAFVVQWQAGRQEMIWPMSEWPGSPGTYCKLSALTPPMFPYPTDVDWNGKIDTGDVAAVGYALDTIPGDERWQFVADVDKNGEVRDVDHSSVCFDFGKLVDLPLEYCNEDKPLIG